MGQIVIVVKDMRNRGRAVPVTLRSDMQPDEVAEEIRRALGYNEPLVFYVRRPDGTVVPIQTPDAIRLSEISRSGSEILAEPRSVYGFLLFHRHARELQRYFPSIHYNEELNAYVMEAYSTVDGNKYQITIYESQNYPIDPPRVEIFPYPRYVEIHKKYEDNHARRCCWVEEKDSGRYCRFHIDEGAWAVVKDSSNPLLYIIENIIQSLDIQPLIYY